MTGEAGSGKSALLANWLNLTKGYNKYVQIVLCTNALSWIDNSKQILLIELHRSHSLTAVV